MSTKSWHRIRSMRSLVVHTGGVGDFLVACPALYALRQQGRVELAGHCERLSIALAAGIVDAIHDLDRIGWHTLYSEPGADLLRMLRGFDRVVVFLRDDGSIAARLAAADITHVVFHAGIPATDWRAHASAYYAQALGVEVPPTFALGLPRADAWDIVIHPGSGGRSKNWPMAHFEAIASRLGDVGREVTWLRGPAEEALEYPSGAYVAPFTSLVELGGRLAMSRGYLGNDSGITHLSAMTGCPTVAIFASSNPAIWAPLGARVQVVAGRPWPDLDAVYAALLQEISPREAC